MFFVWREDLRDCLVCYDGFEEWNEPVYYTPLHTKGQHKASNTQDSIQNADNSAKNPPLKPFLFTINFLKNVS